MTATTSTSTGINIPSSVIVEHIFPYLDRATYDSCRVLNKYIWQLSQEINISNPPWPTTASSSSSSSSTTGGDGVMSPCLRLQREIACLAVSERALAVGCETTGEVIIVVRRTMKRYILRGRAQHEHDHRSPAMAVTSIQFSPDETLLATGRVDGSIQIWHLQDTKDNVPCLWDASSLTSSCTSATTTTYFTLPDNDDDDEEEEATTITPYLRNDDHHSSHLIEYACAFVTILNGHTQPVHSLEFTPDCQTLVSTANESTILFWNTSTGDCQGRIVERWEQFVSLCLSPDGQTLAACGWNGSIRLYSSFLFWNTQHKKKSTKGGRILLSKEELPLSTTIFQFSEDGSLLYSHRTGHHDVDVWDVQSGIKLNVSSTTSSSFSLTSLSSLHSLNGVVLEQQQQRHMQKHPLTSLKGCSTSTMATILSRKGDTVASVTPEGTISISHFDWGHHDDHDNHYWSVYHMKASDRGSYHMKFTPDGRTVIAVSCHNGTVEFWNVVASARQQRYY